MSDYSLTNQNEIGYIQKYGGHQFALCECNEDASDEAGKVFFELPDAEKYSIKYERKAEKINNAKGDLKKVIYGERDCEFKITSLESNAALFNWVINSTVGKYYKFIGYNGNDDDNTNQFIVCPIVQVEPSFSIEVEGRRPIITLTPITPKVAWNFNSISASTGSITGWSPTPLALTGSLTGAAYSEPMLAVAST